MKKSFVICMLIVAGIQSVYAQKMTVKDSDSNILMEVNDEGTMGSITLPDTNTALSSETNKLYNLNGSLIWNGSALSTGGASDINSLSDGKTGGNSVFLGATAGANDDGTDNKNVGIGIGALNANNTGEENTAAGYQTLYSNTSGQSNTASGYQALRLNTVGSNNTAFGNGALSSSIGGDANTACGRGALGDNTIGNGNTAIGYGALSSNTTGGYNTILGYGAASLNQEGSNNTIVGYQAGMGTYYHNKNGNVLIGYQAGYSEEGDNKLYIENSNSDTPLIGGDFAADEVYLNGR